MVECYSGVYKTPEPLGPSPAPFITIVLKPSLFFKTYFYLCIYFESICHVMKSQKKASDSIELEFQDVVS